MQSDYHGIQEVIRGQFYRYFGDVNPEYGYIEESLSPSPSEADWGKLLELRIIPLHPDRCRLSMWVGEKYCKVYVGHNIEFEFNSHFNSDVSSYPDNIEKIVRAVAYGNVSEIKWELRNRTFYKVCCIKLEAKTICGGLLPINLLKMILKFIQSIKMHEIAYNPYLS
jgi:hypothetical protein